jgi:hypothetical protein
MEEEEMATYGSTGTREVKAREAYECERCRGTIDRGETYLNYHSVEKKGNWRGRRHADCEAAWWQGDASHLLSALTKIPGHAPPSADTRPELQGIPLSIRTSTLNGEHFTLLSPDFALRLLHTHDLGLRSEALQQIGRAEALFLECLVASSSNRKMALQMSHLLQQMAQIAQIDPYRS